MCADYIYNIYIYIYIYIYQLLCVKSQTSALAFDGETGSLLLTLWQSPIQSSTCTGFWQWSHPVSLNVYLMNCIVSMLKRQVHCAVKYRPYVMCNNMALIGIDSRLNRKPKCAINSNHSIAMMYWIVKDEIISRYTLCKWSIRRKCIWKYYI